MNTIITSCYLLRKKAQYRFLHYSGMDEPTLFLSEVPTRTLDATENGFHKHHRQNKHCASARAISNVAARTIGYQCFPKQLKRKHVVTSLLKPFRILVFKDD